MSVWKVSYIALEDRMLRRPFFKRTAYAEGLTRQEAIERVQHYHDCSSRYGEFRASKAEGKQADCWFRA